MKGIAPPLCSHESSVSHLLEVHLHFITDSDDQEATQALNGGDRTCHLFLQCLQEATAAAAAA